MNTTSSTTSALNFLDDVDASNPPFLSCPDCQCLEYEVDISSAICSWILLKKRRTVFSPRVPRPAAVFTDLPSAKEDIYDLDEFAVGHVAALENASNSW